MILLLGAIRSRPFKPRQIPSCPTTRTNPILVLKRFLRSRRWRVFSDETVAAQTYGRDDFAINPLPSLIACIAGWMHRHGAVQKPERHSMLAARHPPAQTQRRLQARLGPRQRQARDARFRRMHGRSALVGPVQQRGPARLLLGVRQTLASHRPLATGSTPSRTSTTSPSCAKAPWTAYSKATGRTKATRAISCSMAD